MAEGADTSIHSEEEEEEEELEQEVGAETSDIGRLSDDDSDDDTRFSDAESIQLDSYEESIVLAVRRGGGVISNQKYNSMVEIRKRLMMYKERGNISNLRREIKNLSWELDKMGAAYMSGIDRPGGVGNPRG